MKASEARNLVKSSYLTEADTYLQSLYKSIKTHAEHGHANVQVRVPPQNIYSTIINRLQEDGYYVREINEIDEYNELIISW